MKIIGLVLAILGSSFFNTTLAKGNIDIDNELKKVVKFENNQLQIEKNQTAFVKVSFRINEGGEVEVLELNYSDENVKSQLINKLSKMKIKRDHDSSEVYNYNFTFKKL
jgi:hypothetical protein